MQQVRTTQNQLIQSEKLSAVGQFVAVHEQVLGAEKPYPLCPMGKDRPDDTPMLDVPPQAHQSQRKSGHAGTAFGEGNYSARNREREVESPDGWKGKTR